MGHHEALEVLLQHLDANVNAGRTIDGGTAFSISSEKSHFKVMRALVENGKSDESKGWCSHQWANPCKGSKDELTETSSTTMPGEVN